MKILNYSLLVLLLLLGRGHLEILTQSTPEVSSSEIPLVTAESTVSLTSDTTSSPTTITTTTESAVSPTSVGTTTVTTTTTSAPTPSTESSTVSSSSSALPTSISIASTTSTELITTSTVSSTDSSTDVTTTTAELLTSTPSLNWTHAQSNDFYKVTIYARNTPMAVTLHQQRYQFTANAHSLTDEEQVKWNGKFYGEYLSSVVINAHEGFIFMDSKIRDLAASKRYAAPMRSNEIVSEKTEYELNNDDLHITWSGIDAKDDSSFTFQASLFSSGRIVFYYDHLPPSLQLSSDVKIGLSSVYYSSPNDPSITFHPYGEISINRALLHDDVIIQFMPSRTCVEQKTCADCLDTSQPSCTWCSLSSLCSSGLDANTGKWNAQCSNLTFVSDCYHPSDNYPPEGRALEVLFYIFFIILLILLVGLLVYMCIYVYKNPSSRLAGQVRQCCFSIQSCCRNLIRCKCCPQNREDYRVFYDSSFHA